MKFQGAINFRDMGGCVSLQGHKLKSNKFFRSGALSKLTSEDLSQMQSLAIGHVIDYRDPRESEMDKDLLWSEVQYENCPANPASHRMSANLGSFFTTEHLENVPAGYMEDLYRQLPVDNPAYHRMFSVMDSMSSKAMLQHCAVGKDRTGVGCALMLLALGVDEDQVMKDYLLTQKGLEPFRLSLMKQFESKLSAKAMERFHYMMGAHEEFLGAALSAMKKDAGDVQTFLRKQYGITESRQQNWLGKFFE